MINRFRNLFLTSAITIGLALFSSHNAYAATYTVGQGDSLYSIGQLFNTNYSTILKDNNISGTNIYPGQSLYVNCRTYTVKSGDSLYSIAKQFGLTLGTLRKVNNQWTDQIYVGQVLNVPNYYSSGQAVISYTQSDVDLLARLICAEAQGEPYNAKVAVGAVIINRVQSGSFANTISGVIYQRINGYYQFTPVLNGWINKPADSDSIKAAYAALYGADPTNGALFYFDDSTTNTWLWSKKIAITIDKMVFAY